MGFLMVGSQILQSQLHPPIPSPFPSPRSSSAYTHGKVAKRKQQSPVASVHGESPVSDGGSSRRRAILLVGISILPFLHLQASAMEGNRRRSRSRSLGRGFRSAGAAGENQREKGVGNASPNKGDLGKPEDQGPKQAEDEFLSQEPKKSEAVVIGNPESQGLKQGEQEISSQGVIVVRKTEEQGPNGEEYISFQEPNQSEQVNEQNAPGNLLLSLLNEIGIIGSGVLGALYAGSKKKNATMESTIESMKMELSENESATALLKENFEMRLLNEQGDRRKEVTKLKEDNAFLSNQLASASQTIAAFRLDIQSEKRSSEELESRISKLENDIIQVLDEKKLLEVKLKEKINTIDVLQDKVNLLSLEINDKEKSVEHLKLSISEKESEAKKLSAALDQTKADLAKAGSTIEQLREEIRKAIEEIIVKKSSIDDLNDRIKSLHSEKSETNRKLHELTSEYNDLKSFSERKQALDSELLSEKSNQLFQLEERLGTALSQGTANQATIAKLTKERDTAKTLIEEKVSNMKKLKDDLWIAQEALGASSLEASNLSKELKETKILYEELLSGASRIKDEYIETNKLLNKNLETEKATTEVLSDELATIKEVLKTTMEDLGVTSSELKDVLEERDNLKKELLDVYKKTESTTHDLKEERQMVATLNREIEILRKQILKDSESRKSLEADLDEATRSLDEMNQSALVLSKELENTNSRTASLDTEKNMLFMSLIEQKNLAKEARETVEDAQNLISRLVSDKESMEKRSKKLEKELGAAKGEILRLRRQISMNKESVNEHPTEEVGIPFGVKKASRRRGGSTPEGS